MYSMCVDQKKTQDVSPECWSFPSLCDSYLKGTCKGAVGPKNEVVWGQVWW